MKKQRYIQSIRVDGSEICRVCSAKEALDAAGVVEQEEVLAEIKLHENG